MSSWMRAPLTLLAYLALAVVWTWPLATDPLGLDVSRQMDSPNTLGLAWAAAHAPELFWAPSLNWPTGQALHRGDSFVFFALARLLAQLGAGEVAAPAAIASCLLLGPAISALAAEQAARALGARSPWSLLAGVAYGFSGLQATAVLEGYGFNLFNPWLPWMAAAALRAGEPDAPLRQGLLAALCWMLCLLTSAYAGLGASLLLVVILGGATLRDRRPSRAALLSIGLVLLQGGLFSAFFLLAPPLARRPAFDPALGEGMMRTGSAHLGTLFWRGPSVDLAMHSQGALLSSLAAALALLGATLPDPERRGRTRLLVGGGLAVLLSLGNEPSLWFTDRGVPGLLAPLASTPLAGFLRFPERLLLPATLAFGVLGALALSRIAEARPWPAALLLLGAAFEATVMVGMPARLGHRSWPAAEGLQAIPAERAILEVWPRYLGRADASEMLLSRRCVGRAARHGRPVLCNGLNVSNQLDERGTVSMWLLERARLPEPAAADRPRDEETRQSLGALGVGGVLVHMDLFPPGQRDRLVEDLGRLFGAPASRSRTDGEHLWLWTLPGAGAPPDLERRTAALAAMAEELR